jgi:hypothetical protein
VAGEHADRSERARQAAARHEERAGEADDRVERL